jgi:two-component system LytT family sensor kinase
MKVRWREHEMIFITLLVIIQIIIYLKGMYDAAHGVSAIDYEKGFREAGWAFAYWREVFIPQVASVLLVFGAYLSVNRVIIPFIKKVPFKDVERLLSWNILAFILGIVITGYLLAIGVNIVSYYAKPYLFSYGGYRHLALLGYNDRPLSNLFDGVGPAVSLVLIITTIAGLRELIGWMIGRPGGKREFRVLIANNITPLVFIYLLFLILLNPEHNDFLLYFGCVTPVFLVYLFTTFWIFPFKGGAPFTHRPVLIRLLVSTFSCSLLSVITFQGGRPVLFFLLYWAFLLFVVTYLSWLLYQQRKDQILQLKGMQTALAKSDANLQLLRSQINPHFLFNALNTLYATALQKDSEKTAEGIQQLGDMMRFMLEENTQDFISMEKEIDYLKNYISLQKLRIQSSPGIVIEDNIEEVKCSHQVAPMLFIPFVENAFKHGISLKERSWISIQMECSATEIRFEVRNSVHARNNLETGRSGIGLKNVTERLKLLYPRKHNLYIDKGEKEFVARLLIQSNNKPIK